MTLKQGNMWESGCDVVLFTGNASIRKDGCLVMGRGAALEAQTQFPGCNKVFGQLISDYGKQFPGAAYGVITVQNSWLTLGCFQVKWHFYNQASTNLISYSTSMLSALAKTDWKKKKVAVNFPGIGYGGLKREVVLPLIQSLPDNVEVWEYIK